MSTFQDVVLSNDLLKLFYTVQRRCLRCGSSADNGTEDGFDFDRAKRLFAYYKPHLTNIRQLEEVLGSDNIDVELRASLIQSEIPKDAALEQLAELTRYKIILDEQKNVFPYVRIDGRDLISLLYSGCFCKDKNRKKCVDHLKSLSKGAKVITIYDRYLLKDRTVQERQDLLTDIFSLLDLSNKVTLNIVYFNDSLIDGLNDKEALNAYLKEKQQQNQNLRYMLTECFKSEYNECHDRYMKIFSDTGSVEILLSSGFDHLFNNEKDFTYIIRPLN